MTTDRLDQTSSAFLGSLGAKRKANRYFPVRRVMQMVGIITAFSVVLPYQELEACACSTVVVGQGAVGSNMGVDNGTAELNLSQTDIDLPGIVPVRLVRRYMSGNGGVGIFGFGWTADFSTHLISDSGDIEVDFQGGAEKFKQADGYYNDNRSKRVAFTGEDEITILAKTGEKWVFDTASKFLKDQYDRNGNRTSFEWKTEEYAFWNKEHIVYCPLKVTFPGNREMTFTYHTDAGKKHLVQKVNSPNGLEIEYTYTDNLLTGLVMNTGQVLSYNYHIMRNSQNPDWVQGWLTKITYANGGDVEITYNGQYGQSGKLKVTKVIGPLGYKDEYSYSDFTSETDSSEGGVQVIRRPNVTVTKRDSLNHETIYERTDNQKRLRTIDALGNWEESVYDANFLLTHFRNKRGKITSYTYDTGNSNVFARSNRLTTTNPLNKTWIYEYDSNNFRTKTTDPLGHTTQASYDASGNVLTRKNGLEQTTVTNTYTTTGAKGLVATTKDGLNNQTNFEYNDYGLLTKIIDPAGKEITCGYATDGSGNQVSMTNQLGKMWQRQYNGFSKVSKTIDPLGNETAFEYDTMANLTKITDAEGRVTQKQYDQLQRVTSITDALSQTTLISYDSVGNITGITDALGREYSYSFDEINKTKIFRFPDDKQENYSYDADGNLTRVAGRNGCETIFSYDDAGRLVEKTLGGTVTTVIAPTYDEADRLSGLTKTEGQVTVSQIGVIYNAADQITSVNAEGNSVQYAYDAAQRLNQITYPSMDVVKYEFNNRGLLESVKDGDNAAIIDYTFDDGGRIIKSTLPNGLETVYEYNDANWLTKITLRKTSNPQDVLQSFQYGYNNVGNRIWVQYADGTGDVYHYDQNDQLIGAKYGVSNPQDGYSSSIGGSRMVNYTYDALGNRMIAEDNQTLTNYAVNNLNQYTQVGNDQFYTYDDNGNLTNDGVWTFGYDNEKHLISASKDGFSIQYKYDAMGRRIEKNVNCGTITRYIYSGQDLIEERDGNNNVTAKYIYAGGIDNPVKVVRGANVYYFQKDAVGNVMALTNESGNIVESYLYDAFGKPKIRNENGELIDRPSTPFLFAGREYDFETGLYHYRSRVYSPVLGRFYQMDPIGFGGGDFNLYKYAKNNPLSYTDPNGTNPVAGALAFLAEQLVQMMMSQCGSIKCQETCKLCCAGAGVASGALLVAAVTGLLLSCAGPWAPICTLAVVAASIVALANFKQGLESCKASCNSLPKEAPPDCCKL